ncbi:PD-(D/E)XK nuclease family protein [Acidiphilium acidophilum]|uniref:PDDEXK-like family protein n=1 Tax=Acidiphilium acidophilum TaxID=76588 RepID=UPI002E8E6930|nr:PD-(D/E)XK nuclease family protein [Acidiphilium acidophilum]
MFDFIEPDEMRLSKILAWLLDPQGTHGQSGKFLRLLFDAIGMEIKTDECNRAEIQTEHSIENGRLDIVVRMASFRLIIENKPWAVDQQRQIQRYFEHLDQNDRSDYAIIYLTSKGTTPSTDSISDEERKLRITNKQLHIWAYETKVIEWLAQCRIQCRSDRVSMFIDEFSRYILVVFSGVRDKTMDDHILDEIMSKPDRVSASMQIIGMAENIKKRLLFKLCDDIARLLPEKNVKIMFKQDKEETTAITMEYSEMCRFNFELEFQNTNFKALSMGVARKEKGANNSVEYKALSHVFGYANQNEAWLWVRNASTNDPLLPVERDWQISSQSWIEIADSRLAEKVVKAFKETHRVLNECGVG